MLESHFLPKTCCFSSLRSTLRLALSGCNLWGKNQKQNGKHSLWGGGLQSVHLTYKSRVDVSIDKSRSGQHPVFVRLVQSHSEGCIHVRQSILEKDTSKLCVKILNPFFLNNSAQNLSNIFNKVSDRSKSMCDFGKYANWSGNASCRTFYAMRLWRGSSKLV